MNLSRYYHTVKHTKASQLLYRLWLRPKRKVCSLPGVRELLVKKDQKEASHFFSNPVRERWESKKSGVGDSFTFLNETHSISESWFPKGASHLWVFNLHYFDFLSEVEEASEFEEIVSDWISRVPVRHETAWHPYPISLRIPNWIWAVSRFKAELGPEFQVPFLQSLYDQLCHLEANLEFDVLGNHLLSNLKGVILGALFFGESEKVERYLELLKGQLDEQILSDGGHFERSPMYHLIVLEDCFAVAYALSESGWEVPEWLSEKTSKMCAFGSAVFGMAQYPLLNDSSEEIAPLLSVIRDAVERLGIGFESGTLSGVKHLKDFGLVLYRDEKVSVLFDAGPIGPDYLPGHAHNDTLSLLLDIRGVPVLTDSGVYEYRAGKWRDYFRSARAHNVIFVDGKEPNDVWKSFRVGYRGYPYDVEVLEREFSARDSAYERIGVQWQRKVFVLDGGVRVVDAVESVRGGVPIEWSFHFAPGVEVKERDSGRFVLGCGDLRVEFRCESSEVEVSEEKSFYSPEFGKRVERVCLRGRASLRKGVQEVGYFVGGW